MKLPYYVPELDPEFLNVLDFKHRILKYLNNERNSVKHIALSSGDVKSHRIYWRYNGMFYFQLFDKVFNLYYDETDWNAGYDDPQKGLGNFVKFTDLSNAVDYLLKDTTGV